MALAIGNHLHYNTVKHMGAESVYRLSLQHVHILQGRALFKEISNRCVYCKKLRAKYLQQAMGPLSNYQLSISPIFYFCFVDAYGPLKAYVPGHGRPTRGGDKTFELQMLVFCCAATGMINCQIVEGGKATGNYLEAFNRFFNEVAVPKVFFPDRDGALIKCLKEGEIDIISSSGILSRERGIIFETCVSQGHESHGKIEAKIKTIQESLERSGIKNRRLNSMGWQTIAKAVEHEVNNIPLGYLLHQGEKAPLLSVLRPNLLKLNTASERSPAGLFDVPNRPIDLMHKIKEVYELWYRVWCNEYIPIIAQRQKWFKDEEDLKESDIVYFKLTDSPFSPS